MRRLALVLCLLVLSAAPAVAQDIETAVFTLSGGVSAASPTFDQPAGRSASGIVSASLTGWTDSFFAGRATISRTAGNASFGRNIAGLGNEPATWFVDVGVALKAPPVWRLVPFANLGLGSAIYRHDAGTDMTISPMGAVGLMYFVGNYGVSAKVEHWTGERLSQEGGRIRHTNFLLGLLVPLR